jgi:flagellar hook-associated protein 2
VIIAAEACSGGEGMSVITFSGLATGLDTASIISQLMQVSRQSETPLLNQQKTDQNKISEFNKIESALSNLQTIMQGFTTTTSFSSMTAATGDSSLITATATGDASPGNHDVQVLSLATSQRQVSDTGVAGAAGYASSTNLNFNTGNITITGPSGPTSVKIAAGQNSLKGIAAAINGSSANVTASIVNDGSANPYRLVITGKDTNSYSIDFSGLSTPPTAPTGAAYTNPYFPSSTAFSGDLTNGSNTVSIGGSMSNLFVGMSLKGTGLPDGTTITAIDAVNSTMTLSNAATADSTGASLTATSPTYQAGVPAHLVVDGMDMYKTSNTVTDAIQGVTLNLLSKGSSTSVSVGTDTDTVTKNVNSFVSAYNSAMSLINSESVYDPSTKTAGILAGDPTIQTMKMQLQSLLTAIVPGSSSIRSLADLGLTTDQNDGTISLKADTLSSALSKNFNDVVNLFAHNGDKLIGGSIQTLPTAQYGIAQQFSAAIKNMVTPYVAGSSSNGSIEIVKNGLNSDISNINNQISDMEKRFAMTQTNLQNQFNALETTVSKLQNQGDMLLSYLGYSSSSSKSK